MSESLSAHLLVPNGETAEMNGAPSADQVLLWGVSLLHSLIIVGSCLLMTQSSSTENHYPGCVMEIADVLCEGGSSRHGRFVLKKRKSLKASGKVFVEEKREKTRVKSHRKKNNKNKCNTSSSR